MDLDNLSNTDLAVTIAVVGIILIIATVMNVIGTRRIRALVAHDKALREREEKLQTSLNGALDSAVRAEQGRESLRNALIDYADEISQSGNTVYKRVARELRDITDDTEKG